MTDLLATEEEPKKKKTPISRDQAAMEEDEQPPALESVRLAQKLVGELLWLVTRTRPGLMYSVSRMGSSVIKSPKAVKEAADQVRGYLWSTRSQGLVFEEDEGSEVLAQVYTDASYAPDSEESHGCTVVLLGTSPVFWRSGRQGMVTLSTAEAELTEVIEGMIAGESIGVIVDELFGP